MLNSVSNVYFSGVNYSPAFNKKELLENENIAPVAAGNLNGINALGNYNVSLINMAQNIDIKILEPITKLTEIGENMEGDRVYTSDSRLKCLIQDDGNSITSYYMDSERPNKIDYIEVTDKKTGKCLMRQEYTHVDADKFSESRDCITVTKYNQKTGREEECTSYENGKLKFASKTIYRPNGSEVSAYKYEDGTSWMSETNKKTGLSRNADFDKNNQLRYVSENFDVGNRTVNRRANFYKGGIVSLEKHEEMAVPNSMGRDLINVPELVPAPMIEQDMDYKGMQGEKTYYSNGMLESNNIKTNEGVIKVSFDTKGNIETIDFGNKKIEYENNGKNVIITEDLGNDKVKKTYYHDSELSYVEYKGDGRKKEINFVDGKPRDYYDENLSDESDYQDLHFNKNGMLMYD